MEPVPRATARTPAAALTRAASALAGAAVVAAALVPMRAGRPRTGAPLDLGVYRAAGASVLHHLSLYAPAFLARAHFHDGFTYPPFAAVVMVPLALAGATATYWAWTALCVGVLVVLVAWSFPRLLARVPAVWRPAALGALVAAAVLAEPVAEHLSLGQVGIPLVAACLADVTGRARRLPRGVLVGVATAVKLTPALFWAHYALARQWRTLATSVGTTAGCWALAWAVLPADSSRYFLHGLVVDSSRAGSVLEVANQSLWGSTHRLLGGAAGPVWVAGCALVAVVGLARAQRAQRAGDLTAAATLVGLTSLLVSPVSWMHHGMWLLPAVGILVGDGRSRRRLVAAGAVYALTLVLVPHPPHPLSGAWQVRAWHEALVVCYLALLVGLPVAAGAPSPLSRGGGDRWQDAQPADNGVGAKKEVA